MTDGQTDGQTDIQTPRDGIGRACMESRGKNLDERVMRVVEEEPARVYMWTLQRLAEMGQDAQLYCRASGSPQPTVTWYDPDEREISPDDTQYEVRALALTLPSSVS